MGPGSRTDGGYQRPTKRARTGGRGRGKGKGKARGRGRGKQGPRDFVPEVVKIDKASALRLKGKQITGTDAMGGGYRMARASLRALAHTRTAHPDAHTHTIYIYIYIYIYIII